MFKIIKYSDIKTDFYSCNKVVDLSRIAPENLKCINKKDGTSEFCISRQVLDIDFNEIYRLIKGNAYLKNIVCNIYFYYNNFNERFTSNIICNALNLQVEDIGKVCLLFDEVIFDEKYPLFFKGTIRTYTEGIQVTGLSKIGLDIAEKLLKENEWFYRLYGERLKSDIEETKFYKYEGSDEIAVDDRTKAFIDEIFSSEYLVKCGYINVSSMTLDELNTSPLCEYLADKATEVYLSVYDIETLGKPYFVKYLSFYKENKI